MENQWNSLRKKHLICDNVLSEKKSGMEESSSLKKKKHQSYLTLGFDKEWPAHTMLEKHPNWNKLNYFEITIEMYCFHS